MNPSSGVSVIIPALNEEDNILGVIKLTLDAFISYGIDGEVIVINDGSTDNTLSIVNDMIKQDKRIRVITHNRPMGIGASFWDGVDAAERPLVTFVPSDNEIDPGQILRYAPLLDHVDIVVPFVFNKEVRPPLRNLLSRLYCCIINLTFGVSFNYTNGTLFFRRSLLKQSLHRSVGFFFQTDILIRSVKSGYLFAEVPYKLGVRTSGVSKAITLKSFFSISKSYLKLVKDIYFSGKYKISGGYCADSITLKRRQGQ